MKAVQEYADNWQRKTVEETLNKKGKQGGAQALPPSWECARKIHSAPEKDLSTKEIRLKQRKVVNLNSNWEGFLFTFIG